MWIVAKIKSQEQRVFKQELKKEMGENIIYYEPKVLFINKNINFIKNILGNYVFCFHEKFKDKAYLNRYKFIKGLKYFLSGYKNSQEDILKFINLCKSNEDEKGFLNANFFKSIVDKKAKFLNGPLANIVFEILENNKNNLIIKINQKKVKIQNQFKIYYIPA